MRTSQLALSAKRKEKKSKQRNNNKPAIVSFLPSCTMQQSSYSSTPTILWRGALSLSLSLSVIVILLLLLLLLPPSACVNGLLARSDDDDDDDEKKKGGQTVTGLVGWLVGRGFASLPLLTFFFLQNHAIVSADQLPP